MSLTAEQMYTITELILAEPTLVEAAASWRKLYPEVRVIRVSAVELRDERPFLEFRGRRVYLANSAGVCITVTTEATEADMLILAEDDICDCN